ncbi:MAG TPA: hypothetical protein VJU15_14055 [Gemmatimonadales bacterium]|nr:hypothetical protein [Gemmatimonadales bacterium]
MSSYKTAQHHIVHRGREFHFVSYEGSAANPRNGAEAQPAAWYLMRAGKRFPVCPEYVGEDPVPALLSWLDLNVFGSALA